MSVLVIVALAVLALIVWTSIIVFAWAVARAADEPIRLAERDPVETLNGVGDEADAVVFDFRAPRRRPGGGWIL